MPKRHVKHVSLSLQMLKMVFSNGKDKKRGSTGSSMLRNRQRANMSFFIVVMFFAVFGIIVFTEIFFIDDRDNIGGVIARHGSLGYNSKSDRDYEDPLQVTSNGVYVFRF